MSDKQFPSGRWVGFYTYRSRSGKHRMDLGLTFAKGTITGEGNDDIGPFVIRGKYDPKSAECHWTKTYVGKHDVFYRGAREGKGVYGGWEVNAMNHGGFHIWPVGSGGGDDDAERKSEEKPMTSVVAEPVGVGHRSNQLSSAEDMMWLTCLGERLVRENRILRAADLLACPSESQFPYRVFYVLLARMMCCCSCTQRHQLGYLMDEFAVGLPLFLTRVMRWKEMHMYTRFHDVVGVKKCLLALERLDLVYAGRQGSQQS